MDIPTLHFFSVGTSSNLTWAGNLTKNIHYHLLRNTYICKSLINSKAFTVSQKYRIKLCWTYEFQEHNVRMRLRSVQMIEIFNVCRVMVGWPRCTHPSVHLLTTLKISRSPPVSRRAHVQAFVQKLADMFDSMVNAGTTRAAGTSTRAAACASASVPQPRLFESTSLWHSRHCAEITLCQKAIAEKSVTARSWGLMIDWHCSRNTVFVYLQHDLRAFVHTRNTILDDSTLQSCVQLTRDNGMWQVQYMNGVQHPFVLDASCYCFFLLSQKKDASSYYAWYGFTFIEMVALWSETAQVHTVEEQFAPEENRDIASFNTDNEFNRATNEENIDFNIPRLPHSAVKQSHRTNVQGLSQKIENHPHRQALQNDLQQRQQFYPFSKESKDMIREVGNIELCELLDVEPKAVQSMCCRIETSASSTTRAGTCCEMERKRTRNSSSTLSISSRFPITTSRKGDPTGTVTGRSRVITSTSSRIRSRRMQEERFLGYSRPVHPWCKIPKDHDRNGSHWRSDSRDGQIGERGSHTPRYRRRNQCIP